MWPVWLCILLCKQFTETCEKSQRGNVKQLWPVWQCIFLGYAIYRNLWKRTAEKIQTNVTSVTMHLFRQAIWKKHLKHSGENQTNAIGVTMNLIRNAIWRLIWKYTVEKSQTNATSNASSESGSTVKKKQTSATSVTLHPCGQTPWRNTWKCTLNFDIETV